MTVASGSSNRARLPSRKRGGRSSPDRQIEIRFAPGADQDQKSHVRRDLSAAALIGRTLFLAGDETAAIERLVTEDWQAFGEHVMYPLARFCDLPDDVDGEMDIEGLAAADGYLWIVGSHSLKRTKPEPDIDAVEALAQVRRQSNRCFLGRIPLIEDPSAPGRYDLQARPAAALAPEAPAPAAIKVKGRLNRLASELKKDRHLGRFVDIPAKENGLDIEGIAVDGSRVVLGMRGPVLRGLACLVELDLRQGKPGRLKMKKIGTEGERYRKHFVDLGGLGIRDLKRDGDDLLILAGPTMDLDGPAALYHLAGWWSDPSASEVVNRDAKKVLDLPVGEGKDHPEALVCWPADRRKAVLIVQDSPSKPRLAGADSVQADLFYLSVRS